MPMPAPQVQYDLVYLKGGLDLVTPTLALPAGIARDAVNFEASITGGYSRIQGYERYDGQTAPSSVTFESLNVTLSAAIVATNVIRGLTSGATATVIAVTGEDVYYTKRTGTFSVGETITVSSVPKGTVAALDAVGSLTAQQNAEYTGLAANVYRALITAVPGSGPVRGVLELGGVVYAWRNNAGGTATAIYKTSSAGWVLVPLGHRLNFNGGTSEIFKNDAINGLVSGATATVKKVVLQSGTWASGNATGYLILSGLTGNFINAESIRVVASVKAAANGAQTAITLLPNGRVETSFGNFGGVGAELVAYGCDGVNAGFQFDGTTYVPISTGMAVDTPNHLAVHKQHLFFSFGSSIQFSALGDPFTWTPILGAGEIVQPEPVTAFVVQPGDQSTGALAIYSDNFTYILYGSDTDTFNLVSYNTGAGAKAYSGQNLSQTYTFDNRGVVTLQTTLNYGNFDSSAVTLNIQPFTRPRRNLVRSSGLNREKSQYRLFFSDGYGLYVTIANNQMLGAMPVLFPDPVFCSCESQDSLTNESMFFGSGNGFVYALDVGTSFDGQNINATIDLNYNAENSPRVLKRYRRGSFEITGNGYCEFQLAYDLGYSSVYIGQSSTAGYQNNFSTSLWDAVTWDFFIWDGRTLAPTDVEIKGTGENILLRIASESPYFQAFTINSVIVHYTTRRGLR